MSTSDKCPSRSYNVEDFTYENHCADKPRKRMMYLALHPDKNTDCEVEATNKFKTWNAKCDAGEAASVPLARAAAASAANPYTGYSYPPPPPPPSAAGDRRAYAAQQSYDDGSFRNKFSERNAKYGSTRPQTYGSRVQTAYRDDPFRGARVRVNRRENNSTSTCSLFGIGCRRSGGRSRKLKKGSKKRNTIRKRSRIRKRNTRRY